MEKWTQSLNDASATVGRESDERIHAAWRDVYRDILIAVAAVGAIVLVSSMFLESVWTGPEWPSWAWLITAPVLQLYVGTLVGWASVRYHKASTLQLERAQQARLLLAIPLVGPVAFVLAFAVGRDSSESLMVGGAAMAGVAIAALIGYFRWKRTEEG